MASPTRTPHALVVRGGWEGHTPVQATDLFVPFLDEHGYEVRIEYLPAPYADAGNMAGVGLIVQCNTMNTIEKPELAGLRAAAVEAGTGLAGWKGGIADSYRNSADYLHLIGPVRLSPQQGSLDDHLRPGEQLPAVHGEHLRSGWSIIPS